MEPTAKPRAEWKAGDVVLLKEGFPHPEGAPHVVYTYYCDDCHAPLGVMAFHLLVAVDPARPATGHYCKPCQATRQKAEQERRQQEEEAAHSLAEARERVIGRLASLSPAALERLIALAEGKPLFIP